MESLTAKALRNDGTGNRFPVTVELPRAANAVRDFARAVVKTSRGVGSEPVSEWYK